jgi:cytochrome oxidase assembly protein ShyY1
VKEKVKKAKPTSRGTTVTERVVLFGITTLLAAAVCVRLGFWQLDRLGERRAETRGAGRGDAPSLSMQRCATRTPAPRIGARYRAWGC